MRSSIKESKMDTLEINILIANIHSKFPGLKERPETIIAYMNSLGYTASEFIKAIDEEKNNKKLILREKNSLSKYYAEKREKKNNKVRDSFITKGHNNLPND